jgi:hypothetical protein
MRQQLLTMSARIVIFKGFRELILACLEAVGFKRRAIFCVRSASEDSG